MDYSDTVDIFDRYEHLLKNLDGLQWLEASTLTLLEVSQVRTLELHYYEALLIGLGLLDELVDRDNALLPLEFF